MLRPAMLAALGLLVAPGPSPAHHNFASEFDAKRPLKVTGTVTTLEWTNPHAWFYLDVKDDSGRSRIGRWKWGAPTT